MTKTLNRQQLINKLLRGFKKYGVTAEALERTVDAIAHGSAMHTIWHDGSVGSMPSDVHTMDTNLIDLYCTVLDGTGFFIESVNGELSAVYKG